MIWPSVPPLHMNDNPPFPFSVISTYAKGVKMTRKIYCPYCHLYDLDTADPEEEKAICPECGARAQWEDEVTICVNEATLPT